MGIHYLNFGLLGDLTVDELLPEVLLYIPSGNGLRLVAVEYVMLALVDNPDGPDFPWFEPGPPPYPFLPLAPQAFGQPLSGPMPGHGPGEPWHYELHVWLWNGNPNGIFADWNPTLSCGE